MNKVLSFACASLISLFTCSYALADDFDPPSFAPPDTNVGLGPPDMGGPPGFPPPDNGNGGNMPGGAQDGNAWNSTAVTGDFAHDTQKTMDSGQATQIDNGWVYDVSAPAGKTQNSTTQNYQNMLEGPGGALETSMDLLSLDSVRGNGFPSGKFNLGFKGGGGGILGGGPWFGPPAPKCSTGSVDLSITDGY